MRWCGHIVRMAVERMPKQLFYGELAEGKSYRRKPKKRFTMKSLGMDLEDIETLASDRAGWRTKVWSGVKAFEEARITHCKTQKKFKEECYNREASCHGLIDRFGELGKFQCHCSELGDCNFHQYGSCGSGTCMPGYKGSTCQIRLYHYFIAKAHPDGIFSESSSQCRDLPLILELNFQYRVATVILHGIKGLPKIDGTDFKCAFDSNLVKCKGSAFMKYLNISSDTGNLCVSRVELEENIALGRPATQSTTYGHNKTRVFSHGGSCTQKIAPMLASYAVDGTRDPEYEHHTCTSTHNVTNNWWQVKLDKVYNLTEMKIYNRNTQKSRFMDFRVLVNSGTNGSFVTAHQSSSTEHTKDIIHILFEKPFPGDILKIEVPKGTLSLCEVEIIKCSPGKYGTHCNEECNCRDKDVCDRVTGICPHGCPPGFTSGTCKEVCPKGTFGDKCHKQCHCIDDSCNPAYGTCAHGCVAGYRGKSCQESFGFSLLLTSPSADKPFSDLAGTIY
ncbi:Hypothetical predicted protein [Octopus vulgaris]|uniref:Fucolectin tachylectin-4 pentraxin-1 domain-containing protein n=1 Tax=Octopus vulgaris TaxID=6645 RepID=A0AA36BF84_OCTVU|nr:Hypothetical predicted protein [Octopus vulgaris]